MEEVMWLNCTMLIIVTKAYAFDWYLSYKGKRVSDYYSSTIRCRKTEQRTVRCWPDEVPRGYESYVTVQFGREQAPRDRRDDY